MSVLVFQTARHTPRFCSPQARTLHSCRVCRQMHRFWHTVHESDDLHQHKEPKKHDVTLPSYGRITSGVRSRTALAASLFDIKHHLSMQTPHLSAVLLYLTVFYTKAINFAFNGRAAGTSAITGSTCPRYMIWQCACMKLIFHLLHNHAWQNGIFPSFVFTIIVYTREEKHVYIGMIN